VSGVDGYAGPGDLPGVIPVFPLEGALLLPRGVLPLNIFEPRYVAMVDAALAGGRIIGMVQPEAAGEGAPALAHVGCAGRITSFSETGDGRYSIVLTGIARFRVVEEVPSGGPFRTCRIDAAGFGRDFVARDGEGAVDRASLLRTFGAFLKQNELEADWESVGRTPTETLVNALSMMSPFGAAEKQALLEAPDLKTRAETLVAIAEMALARSGGAPQLLQ
jgi:Lon protease-like protein